MTDDPVSKMREASIAINVMVGELCAAGFSRPEAIRFTAIWLAESLRTEQTDDGEGKPGV